MVTKGDRHTILVAEDDPRMLRLVQRNLELGGYRVVTASDGQRALELAEGEPCSLLVLDVMMPVLDGLEVCRRVREFSSVPIVIITARNAERDVVLGLDAGADDYLTKPFGAQELLARVRAVLRRSHLTAADTSRSPASAPSCAARASTRRPIPPAAPTAAATWRSTSASTRSRSAGRRSR